MDDWVKYVFQTVNLMLGEDIYSDTETVGNLRRYPGLLRRTCTQYLGE